jgi:RNA polymerase sigma-70 factor (ECF subfamily)
MARRKDNLHSTDDLSTVAAKQSDDETAEVVREAISKLSASARELVFLRFYDGMSYEQISGVLGISKQTINGRLRRAKKKMAGYLRRNGFDKV